MPVARRRLTDLAEEFPNVSGQQVGSFHGGEVAAAVELGPVHDVVVAFGQGPDGGIAGEDGNSGRHRGTLSGMAPAALGSRIGEAELEGASATIDRIARALREERGE